MSEHYFGIHGQNHMWLKQESTLHAYIHLPIWMKEASLTTILLLKPGVAMPGFLKLHFCEVGMCSYACMRVHVCACLCPVRRCCINHVTSFYSLYMSNKHDMSHFECQAICMIEPLAKHQFMEQFLNALCEKDHESIVCYQIVAVADLWGGARGL